MAMNDESALKSPGPTSTRRCWATYAGAEDLGIQAVWLTTGGPRTADNNIRRDTPSILAAAAMCTRTIQLGTAIVLTWPRHPLSYVEYCEAMAQLAPGRFRLGVGPGNKAPIERHLRIRVRAPAGSCLTEYVQILRAVLRQGAVDFTGRYYRAQTADNEPVDVPVLISAVRPKSFELARNVHRRRHKLAVSRCLSAGLRVAGHGRRRGEGRAAHAAAHRPCGAEPPRGLGRGRNGGKGTLRLVHAAGPLRRGCTAWPASPKRSSAPGARRCCGRWWFPFDEAEAERRLQELFAFGAGEIMVSVICPRAVGGNVHRRELAVSRCLSADFALPWPPARRRPGQARRRSSPMY